ncbi:MAG: hypothetical protein HC929_16390 [Leptolyngbyaceae cyanobacterium SM2_5_2]|nr:hypothetical protein [Leptolyngbyaceae cyanobacterium SM2_5_2]
MQRLQVVGRLQLPLSAEGEALPDLTSDIRLDFERDSTGHPWSSAPWGQSPIAQQPLPLAFGPWP